MRSDHNIGGRLFKCPRAQVLVFCALLSLGASGAVNAQDSRRLTIGVVDFGESALGRKAADTFSASLQKENTSEILDRDQVRAAAHGAGYGGSLNMSISEARALGGTGGAGFFLLWDAQTLRRSPSTGTVFFESYASVFVVSSRTGRLIAWERPSFRASDEQSSED